jgi:hypothetical protein
VTGKVISVLATIEVPCSRCQKPWRTVGKADVVDGKVVEVAEVDLSREVICEDCVREQNRHYRRAQREDLKRRKWADGSIAGNTSKTGGPRGK